MTAPVLLEETAAVRAVARLDGSAAAGAWREVLAPSGESWRVEVIRRDDGKVRVWTYTATLEAARAFAREVIEEGGAE